MQNQFSIRIDIRYRVQKISDQMMHRHCQPEFKQCDQSLVMM